jgi:hypothetical protein
MTLLADILDVRLLWAMLADGYVPSWIRADGRFRPSGPGRVRLRRSSRAGCPGRRMLTVWRPRTSRSWVGRATAKP